MEQITITKSADRVNLWTVVQGDKTADDLSYEEMIGVTTALTLPEDRPCLYQMRTKEENAAITKAIFNGGYSADEEDDTRLQGYLFSPIVLYP